MSNTNDEAPPLAAPHGSAVVLPEGFHISQTPAEVARRAFECGFHLEARWLGVSRATLLAMLIEAMPSSKEISRNAMAIQMRCTKCGHDSFLPNKQICE
jgi:hypothetical protein